MCQKIVKTDWNNENIKSKFIEMYQKIDLGIYVYTYKDIMKEFNIKDRSTIRNVVKRYGLEKRDIKLYNRKDGLSYKDRLFIVENHNNLTEKELSQKTGKSEKCIIEFLKSQKLYIKRGNPRSKKEIMMQKEDFIRDYSNLFLSSTYIAKKYKINYKTINMWRLEDFGNYKNKIDALIKRTEPESLFEDILYELGIPYFYQWKINKWNIDFYLGHKICIEINGDYWHNNTQYVIEKDKRKKDYLKDNGYILIEFTEYEIKNNKQYIINTILQKYSFPGQ